ncbi:MAG: MFS transporter [Deltaproteobacteria bacterium]|nr:MFS transporter [Deltaproteobacteria bacterium]
MTSPSSAGQAPAVPAMLSRDYLLMFAGLFAFMMNLSLFFLLPYFLELRGVSKGYYGAVAGTIGLAGMATLALAGRFGDHFRRKVSVNLLMTPGLAGSLLAWWAADQDPAWYFLVRACHGVSLALAFPLIFTWAVDISPSSRRTEAVAYLGIAGLIANSLGVVLGESLVAAQGLGNRPEAYRLVFLAAALLATAAQMFFLLVRSKGGKNEEAGSGGGLLELLAGTQPRLVLAVTLCFGGVFGVVTSFGKNYTMALGLTVAGTIYMAHTTGALFSRAFIRPLMHRVPPGRLIRLGLGGLGLSQLLLAGAAGYPLLAASGLVYGLSHGVLYPMLNVRFFSMFSTARLGRAAILYMGAFTAGTGLFPLLGGLLLEWSGFRVLFASAALLALVALILNQRVTHGADELPTSSPADPLA